jgi:hypothetical protein
MQKPCAELAVYFLRYAETSRSTERILSAVCRNLALDWRYTFLDYLWPLFDKTERTEAARQYARRLLYFILAREGAGMRLDYFATRSSHLTINSITIMEMAQTTANTNQQAHNETLV